MTCVVAVVDDIVGGVGRHDIVGVNEPWSMLAIDMSVGETIVCCICAVQKQ